MLFLLKKKLVAVAEDVGVSITAVTYVVGTTFATPDNVYSMSILRGYPHSSTSRVRFVWRNVDGLGIQVPNWPVVLKVSNMVRTFNTRSAKPGVAVISSATRSKEWITVE